MRLDVVGGRTWTVLVVALGGWVSFSLSKLFCI